MHRQDDLIDTTEMYLRCVMELEEDGVIPLRARIAGRLGQSFPTVSQTVARMQRNGLVTGGSSSPRRAGPRRSG
jgi:DtxR family Mn-dependent transcriptional regulator